jgi:hypothetical protein
MKRTGRAAGISLVVVLAVAGCGGGGSHAASPAGTLPISSNAASGGTATTTFTLLIPAGAQTTATAKRRAQFVSPSTLSASVTVNPGSHTTTFDLPSGGGPCTNVTGGRACNLTVVAPIGADTASLSLFDGPCTGGPPCTPTGTILGAASAFGFTVAEGASNVTVPLVVGGIPASVDVTAYGLTGGAPSTQTLVVTAYDADGNTIVGPASYVNASGATTPIVVSYQIATSQVTLSDTNGAQSGASINVAGPYDALSVQLSAPATILGIPFKAIFGGQRLAPKTTQIAAVSGGLVSSGEAMANLYADDTHYAPMNAAIASGVPNGFLFERMNGGGGGDIGYYDVSNPNNIYSCNFVTSSSSVGLAAAPNGVLVAYAGDPYTATAPWGVQYLGIGSLTTLTPNCPTTNAHETDTLGQSEPEWLAYDASNAGVFVATSNSNTSFQLRLMSLSGSTVGTSDTLAATLAPQTQATSVLTDSGNRYAVQGSSVFQVGTGASGMAASGATSGLVTSLAIGYDQHAYGFDHVNGTVWSVNGGTAGETPTRASTGMFTISVPSSAWHIAAGPDGNFYGIDNATNAEQLSPTGTVQSVSLTGGYQGGADAIFDGHDGYLYVALNANLGNTIQVDRISH